jgi:hypothetical protein
MFNFLGIKSKRYTFKYKVRAGFIEIARSLKRLEDRVAKLESHILAVSEKDSISYKLTHDVLSDLICRLLKLEQQNLALLEKTYELELEKNNHAAYSERVKKETTLEKKTS